MDELLHHARNGSESAFVQVSERYRPLIDSMAARFSTGGADGADFDDMRQEALIALFGAVLSYKETESVSFGLYAKICIRNRLIGILRKKKTEPAVEASLSDTPLESDIEANADRDGNACTDPEQRYVDKESYESLLSEIHRVLTPFEMDVFRLYLADLNYKEIAARVQKSEKSVGNAIYRMKCKLKKRI